ncbi:flavin reductase [Leptospira fainei serovar Hurstbridge str. BUT 6]|uniref:Flavin reductase n=1 Tax=Leptospira fainei serovar Hurstbridge str. BUT 6 TaxID=1193011 RepID=S3VE13_9LEPT|nr:NADPH-dependent FMN reductase [Leptospira fainei]EPG74735.1 flavin reductase [Leptospira fainei serovar Hurstbridge str. BUT 6]
MASSTVKILGIVGSLRSGSVNKALLSAATRLAPEFAQIQIYEGMGSLPLFNPDLEGQESWSVLDFRSELRSADAIIIASPEYAHGITGVLKNALDWVVGSGEFIDKPVAILSASKRAKLAYDSLLEIVTVMSATVIREASLTIPLAGKEITETEILADSECTDLLKKSLEALCFAIEANNEKRILR